MDKRSSLIISFAHHIRDTAAGSHFPVNSLAHFGGGFARTMLYCHFSVPYSQAARPPYTSPPAREYASPPAADRRRDTDRWRRQLTRLPKPFPQYPPLTLRYGMMRLLRCASGAARAGQWLQGPARTFDMIVLTERGCGFTSSPAIPVPQAVHASKAIPQQSLICILIMSGSLSHCLSRYKGDRAVRERIGAGCC